MVLMKIQERILLVEDKTAVYLMIGRLPHSLMGSLIQSLTHKYTSVELSFFSIS